MSNLSFLNSNSSDLNSTNAFNSPPTLDELLDSLGFSQCLTVCHSIVLPCIGFVGLIFFSVSAYIFFQRKFLEPIFFYYRLLCITFIVHLLFSIPEGLVFSPRYFVSSCLTRFTIHLSYFSYRIRFKCLRLHRAYLCSTFLIKCSDKNLNSDFRHQLLHPSRLSASMEFQENIFKYQLVF